MFKFIWLRKVGKRRGGHFFLTQSLPVAANLDVCKCTHTHAYTLKHKCNESDYREIRQGKFSYERYMPATFFHLDFDGIISLNVMVSSGIPKA